MFGKVLLTLASIVVGIVTERAVLRPNTLYRNFKEQYAERVTTFHAREEVPLEERSFASVLYKGILKDIQEDREHYASVTRLEEVLKRWDA